MKLVNWTAVLAVASLTLAPVAYADARLTDCITMAKQVSAALDSAKTTATTTEEAKTQAAAGRSYCASQMYAQGVAHYSRALQLLGKG